MEVLRTATDHGLKAREAEFKSFETENDEFRNFPKQSNISVDEMNYRLSRFALEVRKRNGTDYRHKVLQ